ncbi:MAG: CPXCG motif-containing cysteine-rich protein [Pirellulales bacterium]|nr:CPXCG motif-containing cysteine-rich protein [Pirellulales bacterium]
METSYLCDSCGEEIVIPVDASAGDRQSFVEDCPVCCCPNVITLEILDSTNVSAQARRE